MKDFSLGPSGVMVTPRLTPYLIIFTKTFKIFNIWFNILKMEYEVYQTFISLDMEKEKPPARFSK